MKEAQVKATLPTPSRIMLKDYVFEAQVDGQKKLIFKSLKNLCRHYSLSYHAAYFNLRTKLKYEADGVRVALRVDEPAIIETRGDYEVVTRLNLADA